MAATTHLKPTARLRGNVEEDDEVMISSHIYTFQENISHLNRDRKARRCIM